MIRIIFVLACVATALASECATQYGGECHNILASCPRGFSHYSLSHCGFLSMCCFNEPGSSSGDAVTTPSTSDLNSGTCGLAAVNDNHRIVGGTSAKAGEYPWQVVLMYNGQLMCGGTLIDDRHVVTAAHCFEGTYQGGWTVGLGYTDLNAAYSSQIHSVAHIGTHANYDDDTHHDDIAMVTLNRAVDVTGTHVRTACLPHANEQFHGRMCTVTGWGAVREHAGAERHLQEVDIPIITNNMCSYYLGGNAQIIDKQICAGLDQGGKDACQGDSGGPLVCQQNGVWKLVGVVSWGYGCAEQYTPGVYTRVSEYLNWIQSAVSAH